MREEQIHDEAHRPCSVRLSKVSRQLDVSTPLTRDVVHVGCLDRGRCAEEVHQLLSTAQSCAFLAPECAVHMLTWSSLRASRANFLQPHVETRGRQRGNGGDVRTHNKGEELEGQSETG